MKIRKTKSWLTLTAKNLFSKVSATSALTDILKFLPVQANVMTQLTLILEQYAEKKLNAAHR